MKNGIAIGALLGVLIYLGGCNYRNVDTIKSHAEETWKNAGFKVVGYEGYQIGSICGAPGGEVWYIVEKSDKPGIRYHGFVSKWFDEYHIYSLRAIDAISP